SHRRRLIRMRDQELGIAFGRNLRRLVESSLRRMREIRREQNASNRFHDAFLLFDSTATAEARTVMTGHVTVEMTREATLPRKKRETPWRPWVPMTTRSTF